MFELSDMKKHLLLFIVVSSFPITAFAFDAYYDGNILYEGLKHWESDYKTYPIEAGMAAGYVIGVTDELRNSSALICIRKDVTQGQVIDIVFKYLNDNPQARDFTAESDVGVALMKAFPCK